MNDVRNELKRMFTAYWEYLAVHTACKLDIFDLIQAKHNTYSDVLQKLSLNVDTAKLLISALVTQGYLQQNENKYYLTDKSVLLTERHPLSLKNACILWGMEHMDAWQNLEKTIRTGVPTFDNYFEYISTKPNKLRNYHRAMYEYAIEDYKNITKKIDFSSYKSIMDVGGGLGALIENIAKVYPNKQLHLFEKPEVIDLLSNSEKINQLQGDFFEDIPNVSDCIILSRVIHDWNDKYAVNILKNVFKALPVNGTLIVIENFADKMPDKASLLSLNMAVMCKSYERTKNDYLNLLQNTGFKWQSTKKLNNLQYIIIAKK